MKNENSKPLSSLIFIPLLALLCIRPFFSDLAHPLLEFYYETIIIFLAITIIITRRAGLSPASWLACISLLSAAYIASTITSVNGNNSLRESLKFLCYVSVFFAVIQAGDGHKKILIKTMVISASIISLYSAYQYFWGYEWTIDYLKKINSDFLANSSYAQDIMIDRRAIGTFPSPNIFGGYLILAFFLSIQAAKTSGWRKSWCMAPILIIGALALTKSLGSWLSFITVLALSFFIYYRALRKKDLLLALCLILFASAIAFILISRWGRLTDLENPQNSVTQRLNYWRTAIAMIKDHPFMGVGPGNFQEVFLRYKAGLSTDTRYAHNIFLHQWAETGILGLAGLLGLTVLFLKKFLGGIKNPFPLLAGLAFLLHNLIDNTYFIPQTGLLFWVAIALSLHSDDVSVST